VVAAERRRRIINRDAHYGNPADHIGVADTFALGRLAHRKRGARLQE
jgi:hypothetical protein